MEDRVKGIAKPILDELNSDSRLYLTTDEIVENYRKRFTYKTDDERLLALSIDKVASGYSDAYIMYAICYMGACTKEAIYAFLRALSNRYKEASIVSDVAGVNTRMRVIREEGYLYSFGYSTNARVVSTGVMDNFSVRIYTAAESAFHVARQRLSLPVFPENQGFAFKSFLEILGWTSTTYCAARIMENSHFYELTDRYLRTKEISAYLPFEMRCKVATKEGDLKLNVGFLNGYFKRNPYTQDEKLFIESCIFKMNIMRNYFNTRNKNGEPVMVVVCEDENDMATVISYILRTKSLENYLERIYFTGEGIVRKFGDDGVLNWLVRLDANSVVRDERGVVVDYRLVPSHPIFLRS